MCACGRPGTFFSYTVTEEEISLVIDEDTVAAFPPDTLVLSPDHLRAIQVYEGAHAISAFSLYVCRSCVCAHVRVRVRVCVPSLTMLVQCFRHDGLRESAVGRDYAGGHQRHLLQHLQHRFAARTPLPILFPPIGPVMTALG